MKTFKHFALALVITNCFATLAALALLFQWLSHWGPHWVMAGDTGIVGAGTVMAGIIAAGFTIAISGFAAWAIDVM